MVDIPDGDIFGVTGAGLPSGSYGPSLNDGIYVMLAPLAPGPHTIHFKGSLTATGFSLDVTYHLTVQSPL